MSGQYIVIGAGGHAAVLVDALLAGGGEVLGLTDADTARHGAEVCGRPVLGDDSALERFDSGAVFLANGVGAVGDCKIRRRVQTNLESRGWRFGALRHPAAVVSPFAKLADDVQLLAGSVVQPRARIANGCIVNTRAVVEHDVDLGEFSHVAPGAVICGDVRVGAGSHIGAGAVIRQGVTLGPESFVAAGAVVVNDHSGKGWLVGVPARAMKGTS